jgi:phytoene desaturase
MSKRRIIGSFSAFSGHLILAKSGSYTWCSRFEKNDSVGGRARQLKSMVYFWHGAAGIDAWCIWHFLLILKKTDYYELIKLSPAYRVYFGVDEFIAILITYLK